MVGLTKHRDSHCSRGTNIICWGKGEKIEDLSKTIFRWDVSVKKIHFWRNIKFTKNISDCHFRKFWVMCENDWTSWNYSQKIQFLDCCICIFLSLFLIVCVSCPPLACLFLPLLAHWLYSSLLSCGFPWHLFLRLCSFTLQWNNPGQYHCWLFEVWHLTLCSCNLQTPVRVCVCGHWLQSPKWQRHSGSSEVTFNAGHWNEWCSETLQGTPI